MTLEDHDVEQADVEQAALPVRPAIDGSDIRKLTTGDVPKIARALSRAFEDDPVMSWIFPRDSERLARLESSFALYLRRIWLQHDECYGTDRLFGAALWMPPGKWHLGIVEQLRLAPSMISVVGRTFRGS